MAKNKSILIQTDDCCRIQKPDNLKKEEFNLVLESFLTLSENENISIFNLSNKKRDDEPIITQLNNSNEKIWRAGRYIGSVSFKSGKNDIVLQINPRFGHTILYKMFEEIFNIKFTAGKSDFLNKHDSYYLRILISFIWLQKISNANRHGLPRKTFTQHNVSFSVKGKMNIPASIRIICNKGHVVSDFREKDYDQKVIKTLFNAYQILKKEYTLGSLTAKFPYNAIEVIHLLESLSLDISPVNKYEYDSIKYHPMYQNFKDVVDFSWQIISSKNGITESIKKKSVSGFFIDMAELWECYIRNKITKSLSYEGWKLISSENEVYENTFFKRKIIPDIVLKKNNSYCILDAKYKEMKYRPGFTDLDREDFFQIHTYISYYNSLDKSRVLLGGLVYPVDENAGNKTIESEPLFGIENISTQFFTGGPVVSNNEIFIDKYLQKIKDYLEVQNG